MSRAHGDPAGVAYGWIGLGLVAMHQRQFGQATTHLEEALAGARRLDDRALASVCAGIALSFLGALAYAQDALPLATSRFEAALLEQRAIDDRWGMGFSLVGLGYAARDRGDDARAVALFAEGLALFTELGDRRIIALALDGVAGLAIAGGNRSTPPASSGRRRRCGRPAGCRSSRPSGLPTSVTSPPPAPHWARTRSRPGGPPARRCPCRWRSPRRQPSPRRRQARLPTVSSAEPGGPARPDPARDRGPAPPGGGYDRSGDRRGVVDQRAHRRQPRPARHAEDRRRLPHRGGGLRGPPRPRLTRVSGHLRSFPQCPIPKPRSSNRGVPPMCRAAGRRKIEACPRDLARAGTASQKGGTL